MLQAIMAANNLTYNVIVDIIKFVNNINGNKNIPESQYFFQLVCKDEIDFSKHYFCSTCNFSFGACNDSDIKNINCPQCLKSKKDYFIFTPIKSSLEKVITKNFSDIEDYKKDMDKLNSDEISDINNGLWHRKLKDENIFTININTDGIAPFNMSKKKSLWPILLTLNDLRPNLRFKKCNILTAGFWMSGTNPVMSVFLKPFIEEINSLYNNEIIIYGKKIKILVCCCCLDSVARAKCLCMKQYNGTNGCTFCLHPVINRKYPFRHTQRRTLDHLKESITEWDKLPDNLKMKGVDVDGVKGNYLYFLEFYLTFF